MTRETKTTTNICEEQPSSFSAFYYVLHGQLRSMLQNLKDRLVRLDILDGLDALVVPLREIIRSEKYLVGVILCIIAPLSSVAYQLFDPYTPLIPGWFLGNIHWYLFAIRGDLQTIFLCLAIFLVIPKEFTLKYLLVIWPVFNAVVSIIHLSFFVTNNIDFHTPSWIAIVSAVMVAPTLLICSDYLLRRFHHLRRGNFCRAEGLINSPYIPDNVKVEKIKTVIQENKKFYELI